MPLIEMVLAAELMSDPSNTDTRTYAEDIIAVYTIAQEAGIEDIKGKRAVAEVLINRQKSKFYPHTIRANITKKNAFEWWSRKDTLDEPTKKTLNESSQVWMSYRYETLTKQEWLLDSCHTIYINPTIVATRNNGNLPNWWMKGVNNISIGKHDFRCEPRTIKEETK